MVAGGIGAVAFLLFALVRSLSLAESDTLRFVHAEGMKQHYALGQYLRHRYVDSNFLSKSYSKYEIFVRSTSYNRTIMSAMANLAGMHPPDGTQIWNSTILWQPIPVHSRPREDDPMLWMDANCPKESELYEELMKSDEVIRIMKENRETIELLKNKTGMGNKLATLDDIWKVYDPLNCEMHHKETHKWPAWVTPSVFSKVRRLYDKSTKYYFGTPEIQRLRGGLLLHDVITRMNQKRDNSTGGLKYFVYSAHDTTVNSFLSVLGAYDGLNPPYTALVLLELHERNGGYEVDLLYKNDSTWDEPYILKIKGCSSPCTLDSFIDRSKALIPDNWSKECGFISASSFASFGTWKIIAVCLTIACILLLVLLILVFYQLRISRQGRTDYRQGYLADNTDFAAM